MTSPKKISDEKKYEDWIEKVITQHKSRKTNL